VGAAATSVTARARIEMVNFIFAAVFGTRWLWCENCEEIEEVEMVKDEFERREMGYIYMSVVVSKSKITSCC